MWNDYDFVERRRHPRYPTQVGGTVRTSLGAKQHVTIHELSETGCSLGTATGPVAAASSYSVKIEGLEALESDLRWKDGSQADFEFDRPLHPAVLDHLVAQHRPEFDADR